MKSMLIKIKNWFSNHLPTKRRLIQVYSALLFNANLKGYISGDIFKGITKNVCTPGLNCYSCPGAVTSCPLGALQNAFASSGKRSPYYMLGIIMLLGIMLGRWICGWLCPFGLFQDLMYKIKTPKLKKNRFTKVLSYFKYVILVFFVVIVPLVYAFKDFPLPAFCKYICPAGTLGGAIALLINPANAEDFGMLGPLFTWKFVLMVSFIVGAVFIYRVFCRFVCPLGAIYGIFNKIAIFGIKLEKKKCIDCGKCVSVCKMDIREVGDHECINCGECMAVCPTKAISWRGSQIILPENEIEAAATAKEKNAAIEKRNKKKKAVTITVASVLAAILIGAIVYFNFIDVNKPDGDDTPAGEGGSSESDGNRPEVGYKPGYSCFEYDLRLVGKPSETVNIKDLRGKVVVINFWGTWCTPCVQELPHFSEVAEEYEGEVVVLTVHSVLDADTAADYVSEYFPSSKMIFALDTAEEGASADLYYSKLGGTRYYPRTLILDENGVITFAKNNQVSKDTLVAEIEKILNK